MVMTHRITVTPELRMITCYKWRGILPGMTLPGHDLYRRHHIAGQEFE